MKNTFNFLNTIISLVFVRPTIPKSFNGIGQTIQSIIFFLIASFNALHTEFMRAYKGYVPQNGALYEFVKNVMTFQKNTN